MIAAILRFIASHPVETSLAGDISLQLLAGEVALLCDLVVAIEFDDCCEVTSVHCAALFAKQGNIAVEQFT